MKKVAYLVDVSFRTRVVVEVPYDFNENKDSLPQEAYDSLLSQTSQHLIDKIANDEVNDNLEDYYPDSECPYGSFPCDEARLVGVDWDTNTEEEAKRLPDMVAIPDDIDDDEISDYLSDKYNFCVKMWWNINRY